MPVESASFISQLNPASPAAGDLKSEGDDQLRLIKGVLQNQFPNLGATPMTATAAALAGVGVTQPATDNSTNPASTAFVQGALASAFASGTTAAVWVSGTTYSAGAVVYSPINFATYRRKIAGAGTTDPSLDSTNWAILAAGASGGGSQTTSGTNITLTSISNRVQSINMTAAGLNVTLPDATTLQTGGPTYILSAPLTGNGYTVRSSGGGAQASVAAGSAVICSLVDNTTAAGVWQVRPLTDIQQVVVGSATVSGLIATSSEGITSCGLSATQAIFAYCNSSTSVRAVLVEVSTSGTVTIGAELVVFTGTTVTAPRIAAVSATRAVLIYKQGAGPSIDGVILDVTGSTLSAGTVLSAFGTTTADFPAICRLSATQCLVTYYTATGSRSRVRTLDISGSSLTAGTQADLNVLVTTCNALAPLTSTTVLAVFGNSTGGDTQVVVCSVSGSTVTVNTPIGLSGQANRVSLAPISATSVLLCRTINALNIPRVWVISVSGTTPSAPGGEIVLTTTNSSSISVAMFSATQGICTFRDEVSVFNYLYRPITVSGTTVTAGNTVALNLSNNNANGTVAQMTTGRIIGALPVSNFVTAQLFESPSGV